MSDQIQTETHFKDLIDVQHLIDERERLPGPDGTPGQGMKISEAVPLAELWWDSKGRYAMPDFGKDPHEQVIKSGVMMGLPWFNLEKRERLRVLAQWYANIGVHTIVKGMGTSQDGDEKILDDIREDASEVLPVLDKDGTHERTAQGLDDHKETEEWAEGYEEIEKEDKLLNADGTEMKGSNHGNEEESAGEEASGKEEGSSQEGSA